ncbi:MAG: isochorismatase family protein [Deltaproteobacteria bacterium]|nr:isochorismatase family protein [Deltaproteobacteria bacterium]
MEEEILWTLEDQVKPEHTALLVIDPQNDFCAGDGAFITLMGWDASRIQEAVPRLNRLIQWARDEQVLVVWTRSIMDPNRSIPWSGRMVKGPTGIRR